jgi:hypothetical protein
MEFLGVRVRVVVRTGDFVGTGDVVHEVAEHLPEGSSYSLDELYRTLPGLVANEFMRLGETDAFTVRIEATHFQQGADGSSLGVLVEIREALSEVSYEVLAGLILKRLLDAMDKDRSDD